MYYYLCIGYVFAHCTTGQIYTFLVEQRSFLAFNVRIIASLSVMFTEAILYIFSNQYMRIIPLISNLVGLGLTATWVILLDFIKFPKGITNKKVFTVFSSSTVKHQNIKKRIQHILVLLGKSMAFGFPMLFTQLTTIVCLIFSLQNSRFANTLLSYQSYVFLGGFLRIFSHTGCQCMIQLSNQYIMSDKPKVVGILCI